MNERQKKDVIKHLLTSENVYNNPTGIYMVLFSEIPVFDKIDISQSKLDRFFLKLEDKFDMENILSSEYYEKYNEKETKGRLSIDFKNNIIISRTNYSDLYIIHDKNKSVKVFNEILEMTKGFFPVPKKKITRGRIYVLAVKGIGMKAKVQFSPFKLDKFSMRIEENYNDDFQPVHAEIIKQLSVKDGSGITILHGEPGTGKTFYLKHLCKTIKKKILYIPPALVQYIVDPGFIQILAKHKNSILVLEDADNVLRKRDEISDIQNVSSILNIADGMLHDVLRLQIVATFNTKLSNIDEAFLRKGRLIAEYKFEKLKKDKAQELSNSLGFDSKIKEDMNLADIYNQGVPQFKADRKKIGYKQN